MRDWLSGGRKDRIRKLSPRENQVQPKSKSPIMPSTGSSKMPCLENNKKKKQNAKMLTLTKSLTTIRFFATIKTLRKSSCTKV